MTVGFNNESGLHSVIVWHELLFVSHVLTFGFRRHELTIRVPVVVLKLQETLGTSRKLHIRVIVLGCISSSGRTAIESSV